MLECLALEDSCISDLWSWVYKNWSWGFFIAVLSLWFTAKALKKTDKANKLAEISLDLTMESTRFAEQSLLAAKESIDTSLEIYERSKQDSVKQRNSHHEMQLKAIKNVIKYEVMTNFAIFHETYRALTTIKHDEYFTVIYDEEYNNRLLVICKNGSAISAKLVLPDLKKTHEFLYDSFMLNEALAKLLVSLLNERLRIDELFRNLTSLVMDMEKNKKHLSPTISGMEKTLINFNELMDMVYRECDPDNKSIIEMLSK
ncbi:hypothetical protein AB7V88_02085 [Providencia rettgeri]